MQNKFTQFINQFANKITDQYIGNKNVYGSVIIIVVDVYLFWMKNITKNNLYVRV